MAEADTGTATDDILGDVRASLAEIEGQDTGATADAPGASGEGDDLSTASPTPEANADRARDELGRFKAKEGDEPAGKPRETLTLKPKETQPEQASAPAAQPQSDKPQAIAAPVEWKGAAKVKWERLPREVQAEIVERHTALEQARAQFEPIDRAIAPHRDLWMRDAGSIENAINQLGAFYQAYLTNPYGLIQHIARTRGIDLGAAQGQQPEGGTPQAPDINSVVAHAVQQAIAPINQRFAQTESEQTEQTLAAFAADPRHPYYQDVRNDMGRLMQAGMAGTLDEAYEKAVKLNPAIWSQIVSEQAEEAKRAQAAEVAKAQKAAAASLRGSPLPGATPGASSQNSSVLDDVRAAAAELAGA